MGSWIEARDVPWAARRVAGRAWRSVLPLRGHLGLTGLRARLATRFGPERPYVRENIESTLGNQTGHDVDVIVRRYHEFVRSQTLVRTLPLLRGFRTPRRWPVAGREHLDAAIAGGRGVILCRAHLGWYMLGASILRLPGYRRRRWHLPLL